MNTPLVKWAILFMIVVLTEHFVFKHVAFDAVKNLDVDKVLAAFSFPQKKAITIIETLDGEVSVPLEKRGGGWIIQIEFNNLYDANLVVDTGATITTLSEDLAFDMGLRPDPRYAPITMRTANGNTKAWLTQVDNIRSGEAELSNFTVAILDFSNHSKGNISGLLGLNFLDNFNWRLDQNNKLLILNPKS
ncbi:MAG: retropepsin-like aspartic protease family protein [Nitrospirales bacterium]